MSIKRVQIVDEQPIFRDGLGNLLTELPRWSVCGSVGNAHQAIRVMSEQGPHVAFVSVSLPGLNGHVFAQVAKSIDPPCKVVLLARENALNRITQSRNRSWDFVISRNANRKGIDAIMRLIDADRRTPRMIADSRHSSPGIVFSLEELEMLDCMIMGYSNRAMARELQLTERAVMNRMASILQRLNASDRIEAILAMFERGWMRYGGTNPMLN